MIGRLVAITILGIVLICVAAIGSWLWLYDRGAGSNVAQRSKAIVVTAFNFEGGTLGWRVSGRVADADDGRILMTLDVMGSDGVKPASGFAPAAYLEMPRHQMTRPVVSLMEREPGSFVAEAVVNMRGRWQIRIDLPDGAVRAGFDVGP